MHLTPETMSWLRWIPLFPALGAAVTIFFGGRLGCSKAGAVACLAAGGSLLLSARLFLLLPAEGLFTDDLFAWIEAGSFQARFSLRADALTAVMLLVITGVGFLIHVYSLAYMGHDRGAARYFGYLNLFVFFMLVLVMADNLVLLFLGWEGVGLCSYLLIGFWYEDHRNATAANKAFVVNRIGDFGFMLGLLLLIWELARHGVWVVDFAEIERHAGLLAPERVTIITLLLFFGAAGKSAQIPLYVWLPDAMQGPTPVSALIHAATMVTAGVYMTARLHFLFVLSPTTLAIVATIGAATAFLAATVALAQNDIKRVLAYSTVSQLGYMFVAVGVGAFGAAIFHLFTHAFFKACLFLGAGSVIHGLAGEQDMRRMGGLRAYLPVTYWTWLVAALAIAGAPLTAGFFSKDKILWNAWAGPRGSVFYWAAGWVTAGLTALYIFRQFFMVFHGDSRVRAETKARLRESPRLMTAPIVILAIGSVFVGWIGPPEFLWPNLWDPWLKPVFGASVEVHHGSVYLEMALMALTLAIVAVGIGLAYLFYARDVSLDHGLFDSIRTMLAGAYGVDEFYERSLVRPFTAVARWIAETFDPKVIDGLVNGVGFFVRGNSLVWRRVQTGGVQNYLLGFLAGTLMILMYLYW
jgi:NADH-quinone oxidoreductase subunit L